MTSPEERERLFGQHDHVRRYGPDYRDRLVDAGFSVTVDGFVRELDEWTVSRCGLMRSEDVYFCRETAQAVTGWKSYLPECGRRRSPLGPGFHNKVRVPGATARAARRNPWNLPRPAVQLVPTSANAAPFRTFARTRPVIGRTAPGDYL